MATTMPRAEQLKKQAMKDRNVKGNKNLGGVKRSGSQTARVDRVIKKNIK